MEISFVGTPPAGRIERASGVTEVEVEGRLLRCVVWGSFQPLLEALHGSEVIGLTSERPAGGGIEGCNTPRPHPLG